MIPMDTSFLDQQTPLPAPPGYGKSSIADVFTSAAAALGDARFENTLNLPAAKRVCVVLVDGLGKSLLKRKTAHAPFLRGILADDSHGDQPRTLQAAFPSTTATSLASLGTGLAPGQHGMLGYDVLDPAQDRVVNLLGNWDAGVDPQKWQQCATVFETISESISTATVSLPKFAGSAMTQASLRGSTFHGAVSPQARIQLAAETLASKPSMLMYLYWNELDKAGHSYGSDSAQWDRQLEDLDYAMARLAATAPTDTLILLTADHGMVDVPYKDRVDYSQFPELIAGVRHTAGEPRMVHLYFEPELAPEKRQAVALAWFERFGNKAWVLSREQAISAGLFGEVTTVNLPRIGDLLIVARESLALYDLRRVRPTAMDVVGQHGSITKAEREVPLLRIPVAGKKASAKKGKR